METTYEYDPTGRVSVQAHPNGATTYFGYDLSGRLSEKVTVKNADTSVLVRFAYTRDAARGPFPRRSSTPSVISDGRRRGRMSSPRQARTTWPSAIGAASDSRRTRWRKSMRVGRRRSTHVATSCTSSWRAWPVWLQGPAGTPGRRVGRCLMVESGGMRNTML